MSASVACDRCNDGSQRAPRLRRDINLGTLEGLPPGSTGYRQHLQEQLELLKATGHEAAQSWGQFREVLAAGLRATGMARVLEVHQADEIARAHRDMGLDATTLHLGTGFETDAQADALVASVLEASARHGYTLYVETHRATATQDIWRTVQLVQRFPQLRFNADLSHYYTGHEMTYAGEFAQRMGHLQPILERTRFMHARVGNVGCIQVPVESEGVFLAHFRLMWRRCFLGFLRGAGEGDYLSFNPELLPMRIGEGEHAQWLHYAQNGATAADGPWRGEPSDRFAQAEALWCIAQEEFEQARQDLAKELA